MRSRWPVVLALLLAVLVRPSAAGPRYSSRIVETRAGAIRGVILELGSRHLEPVEAFRGVPYAAPPAGALRYRPPAPPPPWPGTRLAEAFGPVCPQRPPDLANRTAALQAMPKGRYAHLKKLVPMLADQSEDCLFLNIYIPGSGNRGLEAPYAVMFFVHGESFEWGSGNPYDGSVLASYGHVIVITVNYRLGILGFLRTRPGPDRPNESGGNLGLRDLAAALRWVQQNIAAFGGDPARVTLLGHGTGAALANLLLITPSAKGLFHRVILLSGTALSPWASISNPNSLRRTVGQQLGCLPLDASSRLNDEDIAPCLRARPLEALLDVRLEAPRFMPRFAPALPADEQAPEPAHAMEHASDAFITCELLLGVATTESYNDFSAADIQYGFEEDQRNRVLRTYIRNAYVYHLNEIFSAVRNEYTDWDKPVQHPINIRDSTMEALSDGHTVSPLVRVAYLHARRGAKTYFFHFGYQTKESDYPQRLGSVRGEDLTYVLGMPLVNGSPNFAHNYSRQDVGVAEVVLNFFTNFAKSGDPNEPRPQKAEYGAVKEKPKHRGLTWETYETGTQLYLSITSKPKMKSHYRGHKIALWLNLIPQLHQPGDEDVSMRHHHFHEREPHYYTGVIRPESFTRIPTPLHPASMSDSFTTSVVEASSDCLTDMTTEDGLQEIAVLGAASDEDELLQHLTTRHYYSYTAALGVTVGVGCLLLLLNMLIFAGIYYQRDRDRKRQNNHSGSNSSPSSDNIAMTLRPEANGDFLTLTKGTTVQNKLQDSKKDVRKNNDKPPPPKPPMRTSSNPNPPYGSIKKRVQIQEISL